MNKFARPMISVDVLLLLVAVLGLSWAVAYEVGHAQAMTKQMTACPAVAGEQVVYSVISKHDLQCVYVAHWRGRTTKHRRFTW